MTRRFVRTKSLSHSWRRQRSDPQSQIFSQLNFYEWNLCNGGKPSLISALFRGFIFMMFSYSFFHFSFPLSMKKQQKNKLAYSRSREYIDFSNIWSKRSTLIPRTTKVTSKVLHLNWVQHQVRTIDSRDFNVVLNPPVSNIR